MQYYPVFAEEILGTDESFEVEVVVAAERYFLIGLAIAELRNSIGSFRDKNSLCIHARGLLFHDGREEKLDFVPVAGDKLAVRRNASSVEWTRNGIPIYSVSIPDRLIKVKLFPVCWIRSLDYNSQISQLKFV